MRQGKGYKRSLYDVLNCFSYALVILAYFQSSRGLEVASKSSVLSVAYHKVQSWSLRKGLFCVASASSTGFSYFFLSAERDWETGSEQTGASGSW